MWSSGPKAASVPGSDNSSTPDSRRGVSTTFVVGLILWTAVAICLGWLLVQGKSGTTSVATSTELTGGSEAESESGSTESTASAANADEDEYDSVRTGFPGYELPDFEFSECQGGTVSRDSLKGKRWVASFIFTRCVTSCPGITLEIKKLHDRLAESHPDVRFVTFTVDASHDTPEVLRQYAEVYGADPERWKFLTGEEQDIHDLIRVGFTQYVAPNLGDDRRPGYEVAHTNRVVLVNEESIPVATILATEPAGMVKLRRILEGRIEFPEPGPTDDSNTRRSVGPAIRLERTGGSEDDSDVENGAGRTDGAHDKSSEDASSSAAVRGTTDYKLTVLTVSQDAATVDAGVTSSDMNFLIDERLPGWAARLPTVNAVLNSISILLLTGGYAAIRRGHKLQHRNLMISAFVVSVGFLVCYLIYHWALGEYTGQRGRAFTGPAWARVVYFAILIPHVVLAALVPFLSLRVFWLAFKENWPQHRRLARVTFPIWMFVSVTGVIIYGMLYHWPVSTPAVGA